MSPANRRNPDHTDVFGQFGWDVLPGFYQVTASKPGCRSAKTTLLSVPPPVFGLSLTMSCPHLHYAPSAVTLAFAGERSRHGVRSLQVLARVAGRRHGKPLGFVQLRSGSRTLGDAVIDPKSGTASISISVRGRPSVRASYSGDGMFVPSRSKRTRIPVRTHT
jgi:hypothetical protein